MDKLKVLVLGDGLLGSEIVKQTGWDYISRKKDGFDINYVYPFFPKNEIQTPIHNVIINCIANTNTYSNNKDEHWVVNYVFVNELIDYCNRYNIKLIHISTDYIYSNSVDNASEEDVPVHCNNWYGYTKLLGDGLVQLQCDSHLVIRCTHKPYPFPYDKAWVNQIGNFDYVDVIASLIIDLIRKKKEGVYNVGTEMKTMHELALKTRPIVGKSLAPEHVPHNTTMNLDKLKYIHTTTIPFFSIAIPAYGYNGKGVEFLEHNLNILAKQTFTNFEIIISDHSTDDTIKNVFEKMLDTTLLRISYVRNEHGRGIISPNLNNAMRHCKGEWIKVLFQDDFLFDENSLQKQYEILNANPDIKWLVTSFQHSNDGSTFYRLYNPTYSDNIWTGNNTLGNPSNLTLKNEDLLFFDEELNWLVDCEYYYRMFLKHGKPTIINEVTVVNRTHGDGLSNTTPSSVKNHELKKVIEKYG